MEEYRISGVWFQETAGSKHISHVFLHRFDGKYFYPAVKTPATAIVSLIHRGVVVKTLRWSYITKGWATGAVVNYETRGGINYLRTNADGIISDNLDNLINMIGVVD